MAFTTDDRAEFDSDDEHDAPQGRPASSITERRRAQKAIFENWITSDAGQQALTKTKDPKIADVADEEQSIHSLMAKQGTQIIKNPREYQTELFERAKKENTIAVLDTGSGKTLISVLLLRWIIDQELERRANSEPPKISFFLVASVTLAYQQFSVLEANLDHKVAKVTGADNVDIWQKPKWLNLFSENKVIVCTADILLLCLARSFIAMKQINLLIFDEAHHAKKNHAYARILKEFYFAENKTTRPRIFGMTASPIDAKADVVLAANELETVLDSKIATTLDMSLTDAVERPEETVLKYDALIKPVGSKLFHTIKAQFNHILVFQRAIEKWELIARELGPWCADHYLIDKLSAKRLKRYEVAIEQSFHTRSRNNNVRVLDEALAELRSAVNFVQTESLKLGTPSVESSSLSSKVIQLQKYLSWQFERPTSQRCIVFVDRRDTARLLDALYRKIGSPHMRSAFLIGGNNEIDEDSFSFRQQVMTLIKFRKGELNCLFATSVAEEGLDVPDCNLVVRFSMAQTMIQYVQSRGRARQQNSKFLHMIENGNSIHTELVRELRYYEMAMRKLCQTLPEDRRLIGNEDSLEALMAKEKGMRVYTDPTTGAKLTYGNALVCLANFVSSIPSEAGEPQHPTYHVTSKGSKFMCEVLLPGSGPVPLRSAIGRVCTKKTLAKRSAAFEACIELRKRQLLSEHLLPIFHKKLPVMRNALLAVNMKKTNQYIARIKPTVWEQTRGTLPTEVWVTIVDFPDGLERKHQPLALITRTQLPKLPRFPVILNDRRESTVASQRLQKPLAIDERTLSRLSVFTFRVFRDVFSKVYEVEPAKLSYWLAPASISASQTIDGDVSNAIDWVLLEEVFQNDEYAWIPEMPNQSLINRFLVDRWDGSRKFYSTVIDETLKPFDPVPDDAAKHKYEENILGYSVSLYKKSRERAVWNVNQPVIQAEKILTRRNMLATPDAKEVSLKTRAYLCPEPLRISALPPSVAASCFVWPAIIHRFESYMISLEACKMIGVECDAAVALAAMTKDSDNTGEHENQERVNFQKGMGENYERLEFIGDTFLKTATTISTFIQNPNDNEFDFHVKRMRLLCNKNLFNVAVELRLHEYIRSKSFTRRVWYPEGLTLLEGKGANKKDEDGPSMHGLGDKTIADVSEALIGAAFLSHDKPGGTWREEQWENAVRAVTILTTLVSPVDPERPTHAMMKWSDYRMAYDKPDYQLGDVTASQRDLAEKVEREHAYHFGHPKLLRTAFIHPSQPFSFEKLPNYQRLEFLGDALLDMACITHIFYRYPEKDPQWLTEHKMAMVSNKFLGAVCVTIGFHKHLRHSSPIIEHQVTQYVTELLEAKRTAGASRDYWTTVSDPPKCLPDIVESFVGAMFIDSNFDYNVVQSFFDQHMKWHFEDMSIYDTFANNHPCTHLHSLLQTEYGCQDYRLMAKELPAIDGIEMERKDVVAVVMIHDEIIAHSKGKSGRYARVRAAKNATEIIEGLAPFEFRSRFGCNCQLMDEVGVVVDKAANMLADCCI